MSVQQVVTCDSCGITQNHSGSFFDIPRGWLTVTSLGPIITADMPHEHRAKRPDLCTWKCVTEYASRMAGMGVAS